MDTTMGETEEFNTLAFEKKLLQLKDTQESIQGLSSWCLKQREHHKKIVSSWLNVLKRVKVEQRLTLFYLANDVIQYSKRKNYEFVESWGLNLQKATPLVRDEKVRPKILRILKIWEQRGVYDDEFLSDLTGLLSSGVVVKKADDDPILDFQPQQLVNKIRQCTVLESDTDLRLKQIHECPLPLNDPEALATGLKDRSNKDDVEKELNEGIQCVERYTQSLQREIVAREALLALLATANQYYSTQRGEVKVVAYAYKNFGSRVRALKRKLDDLAPSLPERGQPSPPCEEDVPSPSPDEDLDLPATDQDSQDVSYNIDRTFNTSMSADGTLYNLGLSSFLSTDPMSLFNEPTPPNDVNNANKIEVINSRPNEKQDFDINSFLKTLIPNNGEVANNDNSESSTPVTEPSLPGLGLGLPPPPPSFYGANDDPEPYQPETPTQWTPPSWSMPSLRLPLLDTPESPPPAAPIPTLPAPIPTLPAATVTMTATATGGERDYSHHGAGGGAVDVDQRGLLPPPPPPPVLPLLTGLEDVDHRLLPPLPLPPPAPRPPTPQQDVDHRNLISLTHQVRPRVPCEDQDYRALPAPPVPPVAPARLPARAPAPLPVPAPPPDIVETVDMDLSEDEEQRMFGVQPENRRNNKVLVGGNGTRPLSNPFDSMPPALSAFSQPFYQNQNQHQNYKEDDSNDSAYEEDLRSRSLLPNPEHSTEQDGEWRDMFNPRFQSPNPRNWGPRSRGPAPWRPRGPQRWPGPRSQPRFW